MSKIRKWSDEYVKFGFTEAIRDGLPVAQCLHCASILGNPSLRPSKLRNHRDKIHPSKVDDDEESLLAKKARFDKEATLEMHGFKAEEKPAVQASLEVAYLIAKQRKPHSIAETLLKPAMIKTVELMCGKEATRKIQQVCLSNDTICRRIGVMAENILKQVLHCCACDLIFYRLIIKSVSFPTGVRRNQRKPISSKSTI